jgi:hypothetical protein
MKLSETTPSPWLKESDLPGSGSDPDACAEVTIATAEYKPNGFGEGKPSLDLTFKPGADIPDGKTLGLNVTNRRTLAMIFGDIDVEELVGKRIRLVREMTNNAQGQPCWGVRIRPASTADPKPTTPAEPQGFVDSEDPGAQDAEIPF